MTNVTMLAPFGIRPKGTLIARMLPLAQALVRRGWRVTIVGPAVHNPEDAGTRVVYDGVPVVHVPQPTLPGAAGVLQHVALLAQAVVSERPALLHLFKPKGYSGLAARMLSVLRPQLPLVVDTDDWEGWGGWNDLLPYPYAAKLLFAWQEHDLARRARLVTVASRTLQTQVWGFGVPRERVIYVPNGVVLTEHQQRMPHQEGLLNPEKLTLLLYTRFWEFDLKELVQALVGIYLRRQHVRLLVVGKGERGEEQQLMHLAERAGISSMIDYRGWVEPDAIPALLATADIALSPLEDTLINRSRGMAKLLELMSMGLPIVAHHVGAAGEYMQHEESGILVGPGDTAGFVRATLALLDSASERQRLGAAAQRRAATQFNWERLAKEVERAYELARHR